jgi:hypothetical protein
VQTSTSSRPAEAVPVNRNRCSTVTPLLIVKRRDTKLSSKAQKQLAEASKLFQSIPQPTDADTDNFLHATLLVADAEFENFAKDGFPTGLNFDPKQPAVAKSSTARFDAWLKHHNQAAQRIRAQYETIIIAKRLPLTFAAVARNAQMLVVYAQQLQTATIPKDVGQEPFADEKTAAFCDALNDQAEPMLALAKASLQQCTDRAAALGESSPWITLCKELQRTLTTKYRC